MAKFPSTILSVKNDPKEIQRAELDLLSKINQVAASIPGASGSGIKSVTGSYTFTAGDGVTDLFVTTGASEAVVTLCRSAQVPGRVVRVWKADDGAGEVKIVGNTTGSVTETISGYAAVYAGLRYQHADIYQDGTTNFNVGQYIQPVALEPSGGTWHPVLDPATGFFASKTAGWTADRFSAATGGWEVDFSTAGIPAGVKAIRVTMASDSTAAGHSIWTRKCGDTNISNTPSASNEHSHRIWTTPCVPAIYPQVVVWLSSDYKAEFAVGNVDVNIWLAYPSEYMI